MKSSLISSSRPRAVAVGDVNNDYHMDFVVANSGTSMIKIFISQRNGTFTNQQTYVTGPESHPYSLAINDFNNDSYADIVVANYDTNNVGLFFGYGNGTFDNQKFISLGSAHPLFVTTGDFNKDNRMDLAIVNNGTNTINILLGYGNGSFQQQTNYSTGYDSFPCSLAIGDLDNDTHLDIVIANHGTDNIGVFLNYGNGTFTEQQIYTNRHNSKPTSVALGDLNNDHILDIVVANSGSESVGIFYGCGNGTFLSQVVHVIGSNAYPQYVTLNDMNKDNVLDIVIVDSTNNQIHVLPGYGNRSFGTIATYDGVSKSTPVWISISDFNNNNQTDVVAVNYDTNNVLVLMDYFEKPSANRKYYPVAGPADANVVAVSHFNDDSIFDIAVRVSNNIYILMGSPDFTFNKARAYFTGKGSNPQYICTGDLNNDNQTDIIVADIGLDGVDIFLGYGNGSFGTMTNYSTGIDSQPWWVALGDFNEDNMLDIVSANTGTDSIGILLGNGNGSFVPMVMYPTGKYSMPYSVAVDDVNNDKHLDIVVVNGDATVIIFLGQNNSVFIIGAIYSTGESSNPTSIYLADFNRDYHIDIVVANTFTDNVGVLLGYGNGTFASQTTYSTGFGSRPYCAIVADSNNDDIPDIAATGLNSDELIIFYGNGNGSFQLPRKYPTGIGSKPYGIAAADLNNDTHLEFVIVLFGTGNLAILTEYQAAEFVDKTVYSTGSAPESTSLAIANFNNDNISDIVVANSGKDSLGILFATSNGTFSMETTYPIGTDSYPQYVITCDVNKDNHADIVSVNTKSNDVSVIMGYGDGSFAQQINHATGDNTSPYAVASGDVNNDNRLDLVIVNKDANDIRILFGYEFTSFPIHETYSSTDNISPTAITVIDLTNDNILDIAATFSISDSWCIFLGYGNGSFTIGKTYSLATGSYPVAIDEGDFNNDNQSDIVIANYGSNNIAVYLGYGNGSFSTIRLHSTGEDSIPIAVAVGDFNNDSQLDIVAALWKAHSIGVFLGCGNGSFITMTIYSTGQGSYPRAITVGDFNNDDQLDIAVANYGTYNIGVMLGYGNGVFENQTVFSSDFGTRAVSITVGYFNRDNQLDIATANYNGNSVGIFFGHGNGSFDHVIAYPIRDGSLPFCVSIGDFNNDNISDIAVANYGTNDIVVLFGLEDGSFLAGSPYSTADGSLLFSIANGDFNNDSRLDIAVANIQLDTIEIFLGNDTKLFGSGRKYSLGDETQPTSVALGDLDNDSFLDIVVANYGNDSISILLGYYNVKFAYIRQYATGTGSAPHSVAIADFNRDTYLDIVVACSGTDNIVIFFGNGTGHFSINKTYSTDTRSRPYQVKVADFNKDNIPDIVVANSGTSKILLLYGYGNGIFEKNISFPLGYGYRPYSLAFGDLNGDDRMDIAIACYGTDHIETLIEVCLY